MNKEAKNSAVDKKIDQINISGFMISIINEVTQDIRLPTDIIIFGHIPHKRKRFVAYTVLEYSPESIIPELTNTRRENILKDATNEDVLEALKKEGNKSVLVDDELADQLLGNNRKPDNNKIEYRLPNGETVDLYMPKMKRTIH